MKISCCCFTCIIGENKDDGKEENDRLLKHESNNETAPVTKQTLYSRSSASALSSSSTNRALSTESGDAFSESIDGAPMSKDKFSKAVNVLKKYNVMSSKYKTKELERQMTLPSRLRIRVGLKYMPMSNTVKVSLVEAMDVMPTLQAKGIPDSSAASSDQDEPLVIQVRTKVMHSEVRGHTKKYEIRGGLTGTLKFKSETIHSLEYEEFIQSKIRFRLYFVIKHARDKLLGEYTLDVATINYEKGPTQHVTLDLYDSAIAEFDAASALSPGVTNRSVGYESQTSTENDTRGSVTPKIQRQAKIRSQDSESHSNSKRNAERAEDSGEKSGGESSIRKAFKSLRASASTSKEHSMESIDASANAGEFSRLKMAAQERTEKVSELEDSTAAMADSASNLNLLSVKLKEKYKAKVGKSRSSDS